MASESKEKRLLKAVLEHSPLKEWHFEELLRTTGMSRAALNKWLNRHTKAGLLCRIKPAGKFPHYAAGRNNPLYFAKKRIFALDDIYMSGLIGHLLKVDARAIILFGSMIRGDWYKGSDLDLCIYGSGEGLDKSPHEQLLGRRIELHHFRTRNELAQVRTGLLLNILEGHLVKGEIRDIVHEAHDRFSGGDVPALQERRKVQGTASRQRAGESACENRRKRTRVHRPGSPKHS